MKKTLVILVGWRSQPESWKEFEKTLKPDFSVLVPGLPGFPGGEKLKKAWSVDDYVEWTKNYLGSHQLLAINCYLLGHSFGGRIGIKLAAKYPQLIKGLILVNSAGVSKVQGSRFKVQGYKLKMWKKIFWRWRKEAWYEKLRKGVYRLFGSDYGQVSGWLKKTMAKVVAEDLTPYLPKIKARTLIIWGKSDRITPLWMGEKIGLAVHGSRFMVIDGGHSLQKEKPKELALAVREFMISD